MNMLPPGPLQILRGGRYVIRRIMVWLYHILPPKRASRWLFLREFWAIPEPYMAPATLCSASHAGTFLLSPRYVIRREPLRYPARTATLSGANLSRWIYR